MSYGNAPLPPSAVDAIPKEKWRNKVPDPSFANYEEFFASYLREHGHPRNRVMHLAGTLLAAATVVVAIAMRHPWYALLWPVVSYGFAWTGHFLIEGNKPATFGHPFWSFISDFRMLGLMVTGRLKARLEKDAQAVGGVKSPLADMRQPQP